MADKLGPVDLLDMLREKFLAERGPMANDTLALLDAFVDHGRQVLAANQPAGLDYTGATLSLRYQDGMVLPLVHIPDGEAAPQSMRGAGGGVELNPHKVRVDGKGSTVPTRSWGVTGD